MHETEKTNYKRGAYLPQVTNSYFSAHSVHMPFDILMNPTSMNNPNYLQIHCK